MNHVSALLVVLWMISLASPIGVMGGKPITQKSLYKVDLYAQEKALMPPIQAASITAQSVPTYLPFWVDMVNAEQVERDGDGIYVAVLDTGLLQEASYFFQGANVKYEWGKGYTHHVEWDYANDALAIGPLDDTRGYLTDPEIGNGHGTHVTSTIIGYQLGGGWIRGVAPKVTIIPVLVLDSWVVESPYGTIALEGAGTDEMIAAGINYVTELAETKQTKIIINMSLGGPEPSEMIESAINDAISKGVIVVSSAGNAGVDGMGWPGAFPQVISAAAGGWSQQWLPLPPFGYDWWLNDVPEKFNTKDLLGNTWQAFLEPFSSRPNPVLGQSWMELDVCAPGASVLGPFKPPFSSDVGYYFMWGTSMAAPHVAGIAALVAQQFPFFNQTQMESALKQAATGSPLPSKGTMVMEPWEAMPIQYKWNDHDYGTGWVTAKEALRKAAFVR